jgi:hypothetical protein
LFTSFGTTTNRSSFDFDFDFDFFNPTNNTEEYNIGSGKKPYPVSARNMRKKRLFGCNLPPALSNNIIMLGTPTGGAVTMKKKEKKFPLRHVRHVSHIPSFCIVLMEDIGSSWPALSEGFFLADNSKNGQPAGVQQG